MSLVSTQHSPGPVEGQIGALTCVLLGSQEEAHPTSTFHISQGFSKEHSIENIPAALLRGGRLLWGQIPEPPHRWACGGLLSTRCLWGRKVSELQA